MLQRLYDQHHKEENLGMDPVGWLDRSLAPMDLEILSFLLQGLSYGRVEQIRISFQKLLGVLNTLGTAPNGAGVYEWLGRCDLKSSAVRRAFKTWKHRLNLGSDVLGVLAILKQHIVEPQRSIATHFSHHLQGSFEERIILFCSLFETPRKKLARWNGTGAEWFAPSPAKGGTSKRLMMWLRWMIRQDGVDLGLWTQLLGGSAPFNPGDLFIPVDTHIFKFAQEWNLVTHKNPTWASVQSITQALRAVDAQDPIRFDFAICHAGKLAARGL